MFGGRNTAQAVVLEQEEVERAPVEERRDELGVLEREFASAQADLREKTRLKAERQTHLAETQAKKEQATAAHLQAVRDQDGPARGRLSLAVLAAQQEEVAAQSLLEETTRAEHEAGVRCNRLASQLNQARSAREAARKVEEGLAIIKEGIVHVAGVHAAGERLEDILKALHAQGAGREAADLTRALNDARRELFGRWKRFMGGRFVS